MRCEWSEMGLCSLGGEISDGMVVTLYSRLPVLAVRHRSVLLYLLPGLSQSRRQSKF
eukprot:SAG31_NODE_2085_length_6489_cov_4.027700_4_plen_57_part_00